MPVRRREGTIVEIPLEPGGRAYARLLSEPVVAFYDREFAPDEDAPINEIVELPIAFRIPVMNHAITRGRWRVAGLVPLSDDERLTPIRFFKQDPLDGRLTIYWEDHVTGEVHEIPATREESEQLEAAAVWEPEHVEDRLRDHFAGRPNKWAESIAPR